jgi:hypothetical protein
MPRPIDLISPPDWTLESNELGTRVTRRSIFSKQLNTMVLPVSRERIAAWMGGGGPMIQDAFTDLDVDQREFLMSGATPEEWKAMFG